MVHRGTGDGAQVKATPRGCLGGPAPGGAPPCHPIPRGQERPESGAGPSGNKRAMGGYKAGPPGLPAESPPTLTALCLLPTPPLPTGPFLRRGAGESGPSVRLKDISVFHNQSLYHLLNVSATARHYPGHRTSSSVFTATRFSLTRGDGPGVHKGRRHMGRRCTWNPRLSGLEDLPFPQLPAAQPCPQARLAPGSLL